MQKKILYVFLSCLFFVAGCTRDDICTSDTSKTPLLIIRFYNINSPDLLKPAPALTITQDGGDLILLDPVTTDSIAIPLQTNADITTYSFEINAADGIPKEDFLSFSYTRENEYINRACAYRVNYTNLLFTQDSTSSTSWIQNIEIVNDSINARNQNAAHIKIFH